MNIQFKRSRTTPVHPYVIFGLLGGAQRQGKTMAWAPPPPPLIFERYWGPNEHRKKTICSILFWGPISTIVALKVACGSQKGEREHQGVF